MKNGLEEFLILSNLMVIVFSIENRFCTTIELKNGSTGTSMLETNSLEKTEKKYQLIFSELVHDAHFVQTLHNVAKVRN
jgi:ABC-type maltose transport system permease subunit